MSTNPQRIDVHHHFQPPEFIAELKRRGVAWTGGPAIPEWNVAMAREVMERNGIAAAVASVVPHMNWGDDAAAIRWARHCNEFSARIVHDDPEHFGCFASLPMPDTKACLVELEYALDTLKLDGVILMASQGVQYLGDPSYEELFQELDRRNAIVFIHPNTVPPGSIVPRLSLPWGIVEFVFDTTRCITNLLYSGVLERYPNIRYIVSHAGGAVPYLAQRIGFGATELPGFADKLPKGPLHYLQRLYYDTALSTSEYVQAALKEFVPTSQVLFGSDWPLVPEKVVKIETSGLEGSRILTDATRKAIYRDNALALFPRFARAG
jgi:predicted TIM-barrel fold metal-dependent hydrolase